MAKREVVFECTNCGSQFPKWAGQCGECGKWNTLVEGIAVTARKHGKTVAQGTAKVTKLSEVEARESERTPTGIGELDRVLGGGFVAGEVVLIAGEPGIGKSTLLTQLAIKQKGTVYVCGEESPGQVKLRVSRMGGQKVEIGLLAETDVDVVVSALGRERTSLVIVDSIQTLTTADLSGMAGSVAQIKESTQRMIRYAKDSGTPVVLVGHVTKDGEIAGPKILEHMVDAVMDLSGDRYHELRLLRAIKNRFGATDEVGVFRMSEGGMAEVDNPSEVFLAERDPGSPGSCVGVIMEGTRPVLVEFQALVTKSELPVPRRVAQGIDVRRVQLLAGVLQQHAGLSLGSRDIFVKVTGGILVKEPAADLAIVSAIASAYSGHPVPKGSVAIGEVGLLGEIRSVSWGEKRVKEAKRQGFTKIYSRDSYRRVREMVGK